MTKCLTIFFDSPLLPSSYGPISAQIFTLSRSSNQLLDLRLAICQWTQEEIHSDHKDQQTSNHHFSRLVQFGTHCWAQSCGRAGNTDGVVDSLNEDKVHYRSGNEDGSKMSGKVVVQETLSTHEIEWEVMERPGPKEESSVAVQTVPYTCITSLSVVQQSTTRHMERHLPSSIGCMPRLLASISAATTPT